MTLNQSTFKVSQHGVVMKKLANEKIGQFAQRMMLTTELKNPEILALIGEEFPEAKTTMACIAWYRSDLKKKPQVKEVTVEFLDAEIENTKGKLEALEMQREELIKSQAAILLSKKDELLAQLKMIEELEAAE